MSMSESRRIRQELTARQQEVMLLVAQGLANKEIARRLNISEGTVKIHLHTIYHHLGLRNRTALTAFVHGIRAD
jgi:two-component system, NarL family, nitrate/nitrite response regulator NarL